jgi:hypothetical protein
MYPQRERERRASSNRVVGEGVTGRVRVGHVQLQQQVPKVLVYAAVRRRSWRGQWRGLSGGSGLGGRRRTARRRGGSGGRRLCSSSRLSSGSSRRFLLLTSRVRRSVTFRSRANVEAKRKQGWRTIPSSKGFFFERIDFLPVLQILLRCLRRCRSTAPCWLRASAGAPKGQRGPTRTPTKEARPAYGAARWGLFAATLVQR